MLATVLEHYEPQAAARRDLAIAYAHEFMIADVAAGKRLWPHEPYPLTSWRSESESISTLRAVRRLVDEGLLAYGPALPNGRGKPSKSVYLTVAGYCAALADRD